MATFYDPDLAKFGNAVSPFVQMPAQDAQWAASLPFDRRYDSRWQTPSDWWSGEIVGAGVLNVRHYAPISDGGFQDLIDDLRRAGVTCAVQSENFVRCTWRGARFIVVHDAEGTIRAQLVDDAGLGPNAWSVVDSILTRATSTSTRGTLLAAGMSESPQRGGLDNRALGTAAGIAAVTALLVSQSKKHALLVGVAGMVGIALSLALSVNKQSFR